MFPEVLFWFVEVSVHPVANQLVPCSSDYSLAIMTMMKMMMRMVMMMMTITMTMMMIMMTQYLVAN